MAHHQHNCPLPTLWPITRPMNCRQPCGPPSPSQPIANPMAHHRQHNTSPTTWPTPSCTANMSVPWPSTYTMAHHQHHCPLLALLPIVSLMACRQHCGPPSPWLLMANTVAHHRHHNPSPTPWPIAGTVARCQPHCPPPTPWSITEMPTLCLITNTIVHP